MIGINIENSDEKRSLSVALFYKLTSNNCFFIQSKEVARKLSGVSRRGLCNTCYSITYYMLVIDC